MHSNSDTCFLSLQKNERWKEKQRKKSIESSLPNFDASPVEPIELGYIDTEELRKAREEGKKIVMDWKGDPMIINPGDNLPLF